jgi:hypothetical protein
MAGLVPAIHVFAIKREDVDARDEPGHDGCYRVTTTVVPTATRW